MAPHGHTAIGYKITSICPAVRGLPPTPLPPCLGSHHSPPIPLPDEVGPQTPKDLARGTTAGRAKRLRPPSSQWAGFHALYLEWSQCRLASE